MSIDTAYSYALRTYGYSTLNNPLLINAPITTAMGKTEPLLWLKWLNDDEFQELMDNLLNWKHDFFEKNYGCSKSLIMSHLYDNLSEERIILLAEVNNQIDPDRVKRYEDVRRLQRLREDVIDAERKLEEKRKEIEAFIENNLIF